MKELFNTIENVQIEIETAMHGLQAIELIKDKVSF